MSTPCYLAQVDPAWAQLPCTIRIEQRGPGQYFYNTLGPYTEQEAHDWLTNNGFVQHRPDLWLQDKPMEMEYCGVLIDLSNAQAWVDLLRTPEKIRFKQKESHELQSTNTSGAHKS